MFGRKTVYDIWEITFGDMSKWLKNFAHSGWKILFVIPLGEKNKKDLMIIAERRR